MALNILIVDDSETVRKVLVKMLGMTSLELGEIHQAGHGKEALEVLGEHWLDLVLTDINMPVMTGEELIMEMAKDHLLEGLPVVVVSTDGSMSRMNRLLETGIRGYLRKPFTPDSLEVAIRQAMEVRDAS